MYGSRGEDVLCKCKSNLQLLNFVFKKCAQVSILCYVCGCLLSSGLCAIMLLVQLYFLMYPDLFIVEIC